MGLMDLDMLALVGDFKQKILNKSKYYEQGVFNIYLVFHILKCYNQITEGGYLTIHHLQKIKRSNKLDFTSIPGLSLSYIE